VLCTGLGVCGDVYIAPILVRLVTVENENEKI
jgi:hypothetical protein